MRNKAVSFKSSDVSIDLIEYIHKKIAGNVFFKEVGITESSILSFLTQGDLYLHSWKSPEVFKLIDKSTSLSRSDTDSYAILLRSFINDLPVNLRIKVCNQIFNKNTQIKDAIDEYVHRFYGFGDYEIIDVTDMSSSRFHTPQNLCLKIEIKVEGQSKFVFIKNNILPKAQMFSMFRNTLDCPCNREVFSKGVMVSDSFTSEILSSEMFLVSGKTISLKNEYFDSRYFLLKELAREAAVSDVVYRGDRSFIDVRGGSFYCNYFVNLEKLTRGEGLYAIDFEYFNQNDFHIMDNARRQIIEMAAILYMPNLDEELSEYLRVFKEEYFMQVELIKQHMKTLTELIDAYGGGAVVINKELLDNPSDYLDKIWQQTIGT
ncbi:MAG: hypothetical protein WCH76_03075 [Candidatus Riflemargulisbacteria bacterium]